VSPIQGWLRDHRKGIADVAAALAGIAVAWLSALVIVVPALDHWDDVRNEDPFARRQATEVVTKTTLNRKTRPPGRQTGVDRRFKVASRERTATTKEADASLLERSLSNGGLLLLRIGVAALAAFIAGAVVQRTIMGNYAFKAGPLEVPELVEASETVLTDLQDSVLAQATTTEEIAKSMKSSLEKIEQRLDALERGAGA
jgi:hypothetical protein